MGETFYFYRCKLFSHKNRLLCKLILILMILFSQELLRLGASFAEIARSDFIRPFFYKVLLTRNSAEVVHKENKSRVEHQN